MWQHVPTIYTQHKRTILGVLFGLIFSVTIAYAVPPGSAYTPGETLDPACAPGDTNCTVDISGLTGSTSTLGTETWLGTTASTLGTASTTGTVFLGINAGQNATAADNSVFMGQDAGNGATNAYNSVFMGQDAGNGATNASGSFFAGQEAGIGATDAVSSIFLGVQAGDTAVSASNSFFVGGFAGRNSENASNSIFIGLNAGVNNLTLDNTGSADDYSILLGQNTSTGGFSNSIALGSGATNTATNQLMLGSSTRHINQVVINGTSPYINFGATGGSSGYGVRDNAGTIEVKNSGGAWAPIGAATSYTFSTGLTNSGNTITNDLSTGKGSSQTLYGATTVGGVLSLSSTTNATKGNIMLGSSFNLDETNGWLQLGGGSPTTTLTVNGGISQYGGNVLFDLTGGTADFIVKSANFTGGLLSLEDNGDFFIGDGATPGSVSIQGSVNATGTLQYEAFGGHNFIGAVTFADLAGGGTQCAQIDNAGTITGTGAACSGAGVTSVSGTSNRITSSGGTTPIIDIAATYVGQTSITTLGTIATGVWNGTAIGDAYISSAATWNAKQAALSGTGIVVSTSGTISYISGTAGQFVKGDGSLDSSTYLTGNQTITLSGDVSGSGTTAITTTIGASKVTDSMLAGSISASKLVGTDIATLGTITSGTWNGSLVAGQYGGTGVANTGKTITVSGNTVIGSSTHTVSFATSANTSVTLPTSGTLATLGSPTFTGTVTIPTPFTLGATSVTSTGTQLNYLAAATGTTGTTSTNLVFSTSPTLVTPDLGTPSAVTLTNATGLPIGTGVSGLGSGIATWLGTPSSANLISAVTDETGSGALVFGTAPTFTTSITSPLIIGGTGTTSTLTLQPTSGVGTTGANIVFKVGNNGATTAGTISNAGAWDFSSNALTTSGNVTGNNWLGSTAVRAGASSYFYWNGRSQMQSPSDGVITIWNGANTDFSRLQLGGTTSSFPSIKRSSAGIAFRVADDSADAAISALSLTAPTIIGGTGTTSTLTFKTTTGVGTTNADMIFQVGNNGATEAMRILNSGNVGIGQTAPGFALHVGSSSVTDGTTLLRLQDSNSTCDLTANSGAPTCGSDQTLKKDITSLDNTDLLTRVSALNPVSYHWLTDADGAPLQYGFVAQEVAEQFPELVTDHTWIDGTTRKFLSMGGLMPYAIGAIKELNLRISPLPTFTDPTLADTVRAFLEGVAQGIVRSRQLCAEDVCVDKTQLQELLDYVHTHQSPTVDDGGDEQTGGDTPPDEPPTDVGETPTEDIPPSDQGEDVTPEQPPAQETLGAQSDVPSSDTGAAQ